MEIRPHTRTPETDEVLRRVGRNVVNFQYVEHLLKRLATLNVPARPVSEMAAHIQQLEATVNTSTMGALAGKLLDTVLRSPAEKPAPDDIEETWIGFRFSMGVEAEFVDRHDREMRALVDARNELIHHFPPRWHSSAGGDTISAIEYLDAQHADVTRMMERLQGWVNRMDECRKKHVEFLTSPEADRQFELIFLRSSRLVAMLRSFIKSLKVENRMSVRLRSVSSLTFCSDLRERWRP